MIRYLLIIITLMTAWLLLVVNNYASIDSPVGAVQTATGAPILRQLEGALEFAGTPYWEGRPISMALTIAEVDPVAHTAVGSVVWTSTRAAADEAAMPRVAATVTHLFFGADVPYGDPASAVVVAQILESQGDTTAQRGDYIYFWLRSGDERRPVQWGIFPYSVEPRIDFFPYDRSPAMLGYFDVGAMQITDPWAPVAATAGELVMGASDRK